MFLYILISIISKVYGGCAMFNRQNRVNGHNGHHFNHARMNHPQGNPQNNVLGIFNQLLTGALDESRRNGCILTNPNPAPVAANPSTFANQQQALRAEPATASSCKDLYNNMCTGCKNLLQRLENSPCIRNLNPMVPTAISGASTALDLLSQCQNAALCQTLCSPLTNALAKCYGNGQVEPQALAAPSQISTGITAVEPVDAGLKSEVEAIFNKLIDELKSGSLNQNSLQPIVDALNSLASKNTSTLSRSPTPGKIDRIIQEVQATNSALDKINDLIINLCKSAEAAQNGNDDQKEQNGKSKNGDTAQQENSKEDVARPADFDKINELLSKISEKIESIQYRIDDFQEGVQEKFNDISTGFDETFKGYDKKLSDTSEQINKKYDDCIDQLDKALQDLNQKGEEIEKLKELLNKGD